MLKVIFRWLFAWFGGIVVLNSRAVPVKGPAILCPNHISDSDPVAVFVSLGRDDLAFLGKSELFEIPIFGKFIPILGAFPVRRDSADRAAIRECERLLKAGCAVVIFPEGRVSKTGAIGDVLGGPALLHVRTGAPIIPVGVMNTDQVMPYGKIVPRRWNRPVKVVFGDPITAQGRPHQSRSDTVQEITATLRRRLEFLTCALPNSEMRPD